MEISGGASVVGEKGSRVFFDNPPTWLATVWNQSQGLHWLLKVRLQATVGYLTQTGLLHCTITRDPLHKHLCNAPSVWPLLLHYTASFYCLQRYPWKLSAHRLSLCFISASDNCKQVDFELIFQLPLLLYWTQQMCIKHVCQISNVFSTVVFISMRRGSILAT